MLLRQEADFIAHLDSEVWLSFSSSRLELRSESVFCSSMRSEDRNMQGSGQRDGALVPFLFDERAVWNEDATLISEDILLLQVVSVFLGTLVSFSLLLGLTKVSDLSSFR